MVSSDLQKYVLGYGLTTAEILYHMPDYPTVLQTYLWQYHDLAPEFPHLKRFLEFWERELDGPLHSVRIAHQRLIKPNEWVQIDCEFALH